MKGMNSVKPLKNMKSMRIRYRSVFYIAGLFLLLMRNMNDVVSKSEACWEIANGSVVRQQYIVDKTAAYYKYFTLTFGLNLLAILLTLYLYKRLIHNSLTRPAIYDSLTKIFNKGYFPTPLCWRSGSGITLSFFPLRK